MTHEARLTLNGRNISFVNHVKYLGVIFDKRITWRLHKGMTEQKAFTTFIRICSLFKSEYLSVKDKLTLHKALIRSVLTYACPAWELAAYNYNLKLQFLKLSSQHHSIFSEVHACPRFAHGFQPSVYIRLYNKIVQASNRSHTKS
jgi:hypothetical protein